MLTLVAPFTRHDRRHRQSLVSQFGVIMTDQLAVTGVVATEPRVFTTSTGTVITSFRLASSQRTFDRKTNEWRDLGSNWYTVSCFRALAEHVAASVKKGERVLVSGKLRIKTWTSDGREGTSVDIDADAVGHDLLWGTSTFTRAVGGARADAELGTSAGDGFIPSDADGDSPEHWPTVQPGQVA